MAAFAFDYLCNFPVPNVSTNDAYYKRQLSVYTFDMHDLALRLSGRAEQKQDNVQVFVRPGASAEKVYSRPDHFPRERALLHGV